ncbi:MAG: hypothetical protein HYU36_07680 [Planctomycetes bacterium]|nr:hypothetical protein [Planctomycetota bacterium]
MLGPAFATSLRAAVVAAALILLADAGFSRFARGILTDHTLLYTLQRERAEGPRAEILFLGDSTLGYSVDAEEVSREAHRTARCLALVGYFGAYGDFRLLKETLDRGRAPDAVVLMHVYDAWERDIHPVLYNRCVPPLREAAGEFLLRRREPMRMMDILLGRALVVYRYKSLIQNALVQNFLPLLPLDTDPRAAKMDVLAEFHRRNGWSSLGELEARNQKIRKEVLDLGYYPVEPFWENALEEDIQDHEQFVKSNRFRISPDNLYWLDRTVETAAAAGIPVYFAYGPILRECLESPRFQLYLSDLRAFFAEYARTHTGFAVLSEDFYATDRREAINAIDHVQLEGRIRYTRHLTRLLSAVLDRVNPSVQQ